MITSPVIAMESLRTATRAYVRARDARRAYLDRVRAAESAVPEARTASEITDTYLAAREAARTSAGVSQEKLNALVAREDAALTKLVAAVKRHARRVALDGMTAREIADAAVAHLAVSP